MRRKEAGDASPAFLRGPVLTMMVVGLSAAKSNAKTLGLPGSAGVAHAVMSGFVPQPNLQWHAIWQLPPEDADYPGRWALIKAGFSRGLPEAGLVTPARRAKRERGIWQRRYWEHLIRDEGDLQAHVDYIHHNPVKHGHVTRAAAWPHSSIH